MNQPKVSIIIPIFNAKQSLSATISSVLDQSFVDWELILIDDGSSPPVADYLTTIGEKVSLYRQENKGVSSARNYGFKQSRGKYCMFLDADDTLSSVYLEKMIHQIELKDLDGICSKMKIKGSEQELTPNYTLIQLQERKISQFNCPSAFLWKKEFLSNYKIQFQENIHYGEDFAFLLDCFKHSPKLEFHEDEECFVWYLKQQKALNIKRFLSSRMLLFKYCNLNHSNLPYSFRLSILEVMVKELLKQQLKL